MVNVRWFFILLICNVLIVNTTKINENEYTPHISAVLKYLNSNPNKVYKYNKGLFVNAQQKADIIELTIDVDVTCIQSYLEVPCTEQLLTCSGFLQNEDGHDVKVLSNVACKPKRDYSVESFGELSTLSPPLQQRSEIELSLEAVSSEENADFVAVKADTVPCVGCPFDINTNVEGVSTLIDTALRHIESERNTKYTAVKIIRLQQQVVAGIKYILVIEIAPIISQERSTNSSFPLDNETDSSICEVIFLQKPWISKSKSIIRNNCTFSQDYIINGERRNNINNKSNIVSNIQPIKENRNNDSLNPKYLTNLESQILHVEPKHGKTTSRMNTNSKIQPTSENNNLHSSPHKIQEPITSNHNYKFHINFSHGQDEYNKRVQINKSISNDAMEIDLVDKLLRNQVESDILIGTVNENRLEKNNVASEVIDYPINKSNDFFSVQIRPENNSILDVSCKYHGRLQNTDSNTFTSTAVNEAQDSSLPNNNTMKVDYAVTSTLVSSNENFSESQDNSQNSSPIEGIIRFKRSSNEGNSPSSSSNGSAENKTTENNEIKDNDSNSVSNNDFRSQTHKETQKYKTNSNSGRITSSYGDSTEEVKKVKRSICQLETIAQVRIECIYLFYSIL